MTIRRPVLSIDRDFTIVPNAWLRDSTLSLRARGLMGQLLSHRPGWEITIESLMRENPEGRDAIRRAIKELEDAGYLKRERAREGSRLAGMDYTLQEPARLRISSVGFSDVGISYVEESTHKEDYSSEDHPSEDHKRTADADALLVTEDVQQEDPFEEFWSAYPDKRNKKAAQKSYRAARKKHSAEELLEMLSRYLEARGRYEKAGEFVPRIPYASTWLNGERWTDYAEAPTPAASPAPSSWADRLSMANDQPRPPASTEKKGPPTSWADRL